MYEELEAVLDEHVRPLLWGDGGDMEVLEVEDGVVRFKLKGRCARLSRRRPDYGGTHPKRAGGARTGHPKGRSGPGYQR